MKQTQPLLLGFPSGSTIYSNPPLNLQPNPFISLTQEEVVAAAMRTVRSDTLAAGAEVPPWGEGRLTYGRMAHVQKAIFYRWDVHDRSSLRRFQESPNWFAAKIVQPQKVYQSVTQEASKSLQTGIGNCELARGLPFGTVWKIGTHPK